jgi:hypothetical protein
VTLSWFSGLVRFILVFDLTLGLAAALRILDFDLVLESIAVALHPCRRPGCRALLSASSLPLTSQSGLWLHFITAVLYILGLALAWH